MTVAIVDSGIDIHHPSLEGVPFLGGVSFCQRGSEVKVGANYDDQIGHGTAVASIIAQRSSARILSVKVFHGDMECTEDVLIAALSYLERRGGCDIVNVSAGLTGLQRRDHMESICENLAAMGCYIVAAFDNAGVISYPAGLSCVVGVDSGDACTRAGEIEFVENSMVNVLGRGGTRRVAWRNQGYNIAGGTSFAAAEVTQLLCRDISGCTTYEKVMACLRRRAIRVHTPSRFRPVEEMSLTIGRAALVPYNKEIQTVVRCSDMLGFTVDGIYDVNVSGNVGRQIGPDSNPEKWTIKSVDSIDWGASWDTLIMGHLRPLSEIVRRHNLVESLVTECAKHRKNLYSFDPIDTNLGLRAGLNWKWPSVEKQVVPRDRFGKLHYIRTPILGVFGTSSQQGKFTLQAYLRRYYQSRQYCVKQIATEPSGPLFGMEHTFPIGFGSEVHIDGNDMVAAVNEMLHSLDTEDADLIIVGGQSGTVPYDFGNLASHRVSELCFLMAVSPDAVVLCVNPYDDDDYVKRTVSVIEGLVDAKVVAIAMFPRGFKTEWAASFGARVDLDRLELMRKCSRLAKVAGKPCFPMDSPQNIQIIADHTLEFFCADD